MFITSPEAFAEWFNEKILNACRKLTVDDVCLMTECKLISRYRFYGHQDIETARGILQYEQMREKRSERLEERGGRDEAKAVTIVPNCKRCGQPLPAPPPGKKGRPGEYCPNCEPSRVKERQRKWLIKRQVSLC